MAEKPTHVEGEEFNYDYLETNVTWEEITAAQPYTADKTEELYSCIRTDEEGNTFIYALNLGADKDVQFTVKGGTSFRSYDILKDEYTVIGMKVHFDKGQSYILYVSNETPVEKKALKPITLGKEFTVVGTPQNYIFLDYIRYSKDGKTYSEPLHHMGIFDILLKERYAGDLYLKYEVNVEEIPADCLLLAEDTNTNAVYANGVKVETIGSTAVEKALLRYDIAKLLKTGANEVVIEIDYFQSEQVYYALFGENVTESLKNCLAYDTDIEAVYLYGDFGVHGKFEQGIREDIILGEGFSIGAQKKEITSLIKDGYPFFSGDIVLKQTVAVDDVNKELIIPERFHLIDVKVNGKAVGRMMFSSRLDVSEFLQVGENEIEITLTVGNRNLLGPFHTLEQEPGSVGPYSFERLGTWTNGKSSILRESYAFVKTVL
jgi:hypothetical protein